MVERDRLEGEGLGEAHLSLEMLARWIAGRLEHDEVRRAVIPHLLSTCTLCRERYTEIQRLRKEVGHWDEEVAVFEGRLAPELWSQLDGRPFPEQLEELERNEDLHVWALCQLLLKKSQEAVFNDPARAVELANLALRVVRHLGEAYDPNWVTDLRARCFAYLGNARRVLGELRSAEDAFRKAEALLAQSGTGNIEVRAEILGLESSLRRAQRRFPEALQAIDQALSLYRELSEPHGTAKTILKKAQLLSEAGELDQAMELLQTSTIEIDPAFEPRLFAYARYNLLSGFTLAERFGEAQALLPEVRRLFEQTAQPLDLIRLNWAEGLVDLGLGRLGPAEAAFREVRGEFLAREMGYDAALVSLDLARLFAQEGCVDDLKRLASELMPIFESRDVHREAIVTLLLFQRACEEERVTVDLVRKVAASLRMDRRI